MVRDKIQDLNFVTYFQEYLEYKINASQTLFHSFIYYIVQHNSLSVFPSLQPYVHEKILHTIHFRSYSLIKSSLYFLYSFVRYGYGPPSRKSIFLVVYVSLIQPSVGPHTLLLLLTLPPSLSSVHSSTSQYILEGPVPFHTRKQDSLHPSATSHHSSSHHSSILNAPNPRVGHVIQLLY